MTNDSIDTTARSATSQAKGAVSDISRTMANKVDENRRTAAGGLESAASTLHDKADSLPGGDGVANVAHTAADKLTSTAAYVRDHDLSGMMADVERLVKANPGPALLASAVIGFLVGRAFTSRD